MDGIVTEGHVKVSVQLPDDSWHGSGAEHLWAKEVTGQTFRIRNIPVFALELSCDDVVAAVV